MPRQVTPSEFNRIKRAADARARYARLHPRLVRHTVDAAAPGNVVRFQSDEFALVREAVIAGRDPAGRVIQYGAVYCSVFVCPDANHHHHEPMTGTAYILRSLTRGYCLACHAAGARPEARIARAQQRMARAAGVLTPAAVHAAIADDPALRKLPTADEIAAALDAEPGDSDIET